MLEVQKYLIEKYPNILLDNTLSIHIRRGDYKKFPNIHPTISKSYMDKGDLVPDNVTIEMLKAEVDKNPDANGFIFDGFPRTNAQAVEYRIGLLH